MRLLVLTTCYYYYYYYYVVFTCMLDNSDAFVVYNFKLIHKQMPLL